MGSLYDNDRGKLARLTVEVIKVCVNVHLILFTCIISRYLVTIANKQFLFIHFKICFSVWLAKWLNTDSYCPL